VRRATDHRKPLTVRGDGLSAALVTHVPSTIAVGRGTSLVLAGHCRHAARRIRALEIGVGPWRSPVIAHTGSPRALPARDHWWGRVAIPAIDDLTTAPIELRAKLSGGASAAIRVGEVELLPGLPYSPIPAQEGPDSAHEPLIAICMATWNPRLDLLRRQVETIRAQTHTNWICLVVDDGSDRVDEAALRRMLDEDERFVLRRFADRLGFYRNFERALALTPRAAEFVALCDQDDAWEPDKLATLVGAFGPNTTLAYSDMRLVSDAGKVLSPTFWNLRETNYTDLRRLLLANTITGAATMLRRDLLDDAVPFPPRFGALFHDHWLGAVALAVGEVAYVDRPLFDYVQHGDATLGHAQANFGATRPRSWWLRWLRLIPSVAAGQRIPSFYTRVYLPAVQIAAIIRQRCGSRLPPARLALLREFEEGRGSLAATLARTAFRPGLRRTATLGRERSFLAALVWEATAKLRGRVGIGTLPRDGDWS
jgi:glycosyltransferase involved in cell wall biosynthesis